MHAINLIRRVSLSLALASGLASALPSIPSSSPERRQASRCATGTFPTASLEVGPGDSKAEDVDVSIITAPHLTNFPEFEVCGVRVSFTAPNPANSVSFEIYLPEPNAWNKRFLTVGNGGFAGQISRQEMFARMAHGFATMSTDTGHESVDIKNTGDADYSWAKNSPAKQIDWAWRAMAFSVPMAKKVLELYYDVEDPTSYMSYYNGCSTGGRQGLKHLELNPGEFDGYLIGAPADNKNLMPWISYVQTINSSPWLTTQVAQTIKAQVYQVCDNDGDGLIDDAIECTATMMEETSWANILCGGGATPPNCLTPEQRDIVIAMMKPLPSPEGLQGAEDTLHEGYDAGAAGGMFVYPQFINRFQDQTEFSSQFLNDAIVWNLDDQGAEYTDKTWNWSATYNVSPNFEAMDTISQKIILYTGQRDYIIPGGHTSSIFSKLRGKAANIRYFEVPGMDHCFNALGDAGDPAWWIGSGGMSGVSVNSNRFTYIPSSHSLVTDDTDALSALDRWVVEDTPPSSLTATGFVPGSLESQEYTPDPQKTRIIYPLAARGDSNSI